MNEESEYKKLVEEYADSIYRIALTHLRNKDDAEDVVQEVFIKYINNKRPFNDELHKRNWLIRVTINLCYNEIRKRKVRNRGIEDGVSFYEFETDGENIVFDYLDKIDIKYQSVFNLFYFQDYKAKEVSKILGISEMAVRTRLKRARRMLKKLIEKGEKL